MLVINYFGVVVGLLLWRENTNLPDDGNWERNNYCINYVRNLVLLFWFFKLDTGLERERKSEREICSKLVEKVLDWSKTET